MDCLLCVKLFIKDKEFENCNQNPQVCKRAILKLFGISNDTDLQGLSEDLVICLGCQRKLETVGGLVDQLEELQRMVDESKIEIHNEMVKSEEISQAMAKRSAGNWMSPSSLDRNVLLRAIEAKLVPQGAPVPMEHDENGSANGPIGENSMNEGIQVQNQIPEIRAQIGVGRGIVIGTGSSRPKAPGHDGIDTGDSESSEEEQDQAMDCSESEDSNGSMNGRKGVLPAGATMLKNVKICLEHIQIPPGVSTGKNQVKSNLSSNSKGGHALRNPNPSAKAPTQVEESSDEESSSNSESGDDTSSEGDSNGSGVGRRDYNTRPDPGTILKEFNLDNGSFQCRHCSSVLNNKRHLREHLLIHGPRRFKCSIQGCGKRFTFKSQRNRHVKTVHEKRRDFKCTRFGKYFSTLQCRNLHVKTVHDKRRDFKCGEEGCDKTFTRKHNLKNHMSSKHKKMEVAKKKSAEVARVIDPQPDVSPEVKVELFECRMTPSCGRVFKSERSRDTHELESHANN